MVCIFLIEVFLSKEIDNQCVDMDVNTMGMLYLCVMALPLRMALDKERICIHVYLMSVETFSAQRCHIINMAVP